MGAGGPRRSSRKGSKKRRPGSRRPRDGLSMLLNVGLLHGHGGPHDIHGHMPFEARSERSSSSLSSLSFLPPSAPTSRSPRRRTGARPESPRTPPSARRSRRHGASSALAMDAPGERSPPGAPSSYPFVGEDSLAEAAAWSPPPSMRLGGVYEEDSLGDSPDSDMNQPVLSRPWRSLADARVVPLDNSGVSNLGFDDDD